MSDQSKKAKFAHEGLEVFWISLELAEKACALADSIPRGRKKLSDHLVRASTSTPLLIAEGANRVTDADKSHRFTEARSEANECGAAAQVCERLRIGDATLADEVVSLARRVGSMLTGLIRKHGGFQRLTRRRNA